MRVYVDRMPLLDGNRVRGVGYYTKILLQSLTNHAKEVDLVDTIEQAELVHYPYFDLFYHTLSRKHQKPTIVSVHDVIPLVLPEGFAIGIRGNINLYLQKRALKEASAIATLTETSKRDINKCLGIKDDKITVTYLSTTSDFKHQDEQEKVKIRQKYQLSKPFILYVGDVNYNKNIPALIEGFSKMTSDEYELLLVGKAFQDDTLVEVKDIDRAIDQSSKKTAIRKMGFIPDEDIVAMYAAAKVYVQPSLYEGFGIPVLNAMLCHTPVICAHCEALKEVGGNAVAYFDPTNTQSLADTLDKVLSSPDEQAKLISGGEIQARKFSQKAFAQKMVDIYQSLL
jgi:glycosyltransferase involved in cell wall biosynthesis